MLKEEEKDFVREIICGDNPFTKGLAQRMKDFSYLMMKKSEIK